MKVSGVMTIVFNKEIKYRCQIKGCPPPRWGCVSSAARGVLTVVGIRKLLLVGAADSSATTQAEDLRYFA